jgi:chromosome partitioning protein
MSVVIIGGTKGGTGKTTMVINMAVENVKKGKKILLLDCDKQSSSSNWCEIRNKKRREGDNLEYIPVAQKYGSDIYEDIIHFRNSYDHIIIDAGGHDSEELRSALFVADKLFVPLRTSQFDIWGISNLFDMVARIKKIENRSLIARTFISQAETNPLVTLREQTEEIMGSIDNSVMSIADNCTINKRICFVHSIPLGRGVSELEKKDTKAISEITALYEEIFSDEEQ